ncbi:MAG: protein arginine kinase [Bacillota bacterium]|nr:protein arginine kinase [Bacillota bacterium]
MNVTDLINSNYVRWMDSTPGGDDIVISSRVRLARNLQSIPFPHRMNQQSGEACMETIKEAWQQGKDTRLEQMALVRFDQLSSLEREILVEKHLSSPEHAASSRSYQGILVNEDGSLCTMINEEDHLRIQCLLPGLQLANCYEQAQELDDHCEKQLDYAFDERMGYLTACPTNVGTGLRASVMLHLPALQITGQTQHVFQNIGQLGLTVRGIYGEGSEVIGNLFQLSNQITLGQTEEEICNYLQTIAEQIVEQEKILRQKLLEDMRYQLEDRVGRAFGILTNARIITSNEALSLLSDLRLGVDLGLIQVITPFILNEMIVAIRPAHLQRKSGQEMDPIHRDLRRAEVIQEKLMKIQNHLPTIESGTKEDGQDV